MESELITYYNLTPEKITKIPGYDNENYIVESGGLKYVLKTYPFSMEQFDLLQAESELLGELGAEKNDYFPRPIKAHNGSYVVVCEHHGQKSIFRLLTFLEGEFFANVHHTPALFESLGSFLAHMDNRLWDFDNYVYRSRRFEWDLQHPDISLSFLSEIPEAADRKIVAYFYQQFKENVMPALPGLRKKVIHNDGNDWNILVKDETVTGIIDFGDATYAPLINELAVAMTYALMGQDDPLEWAGHILRGYHKIIPLLPEEVDLLYYLIAGRLCISVCNSAHSKILDPENRYISVSEQQAWELLHRWITVNPLRARDCFRKALDLPVEETEPVESKIAGRHRHISSVLSLSYSKPILMDRAAFQYMYDGYGNTFLDAYNNIPHVGHQHPVVVEAGQRQMAKLNTNTRYVYDQLQAYAERLLGYFPESLNKVYFVNSGSAASDLAIRLARHHTGCENVMVMEHGYHGHTMTGIEISDYKFSNKKGPGQKPNIIKTPIPDTYRGVHRGDDAGEKYASEARHRLNKFGDQVAAFITEPIVGCGGQVPLAPGYLKHIYEAIRLQNGVCISDEVQTGFGRLGSHFWGFEMHGVVPDIVIVGKPMGNGHPMGAVITTSEIAASFETGVEFFSSFGGNPVSCAIGLAVLRVLEEEQLQQHALETGTYFKTLMNRLSLEHPCIGDVRGSGLFLGFEMVDEKGLPDTALAAHIKNELRNRHILISTDGPHDNVLKSKPPLCFNRQNVEQVVEEISRIIGKR